MPPVPRRHQRNGLAVAPTPAALLDGVGKAIMRQLQEDGRRSYTSIAAAVGLSEAAVRSRVKALIDSGVLQDRKSVV